MGTKTAGISGIIGGFGLIAGLVMTSAPTGEYKTSDIATYVGKDHATMAMMGALIAVIAVAGLIRLAAGFRSLVGDSPAASAYWGSSLVSAGMVLAGWFMWILPASERNMADGPSIPPEIAFTLVHAGEIMVVMGGGLMVTSALLGLFYAGAGVLPKWLRWTGAVTGILCLLPPFGAIVGLCLWPLVAGTWMLMRGAAKPA